MSKNTGGPAFPTGDYFQDDEFVAHMHGMTLRDYFAARAMQGFCSQRNSVVYIDAAEEAYKMADAMLFSRSK